VSWQESWRGGGKRALHSQSEGTLSGKVAGEERGRVSVSLFTSRDTKKKKKEDSICTETDTKKRSIKRKKKDI